MTERGPWFPALRAACLTLVGRTAHSSRPTLEGDLALSEAWAAELATWPRCNDGTYLKIPRRASRSQSVPRP